MTGVDEILNYKKNPDDDYYALLGCDENSTVSLVPWKYVSINYTLHYKYSQILRLLLKY